MDLKKFLPGQDDKEKIEHYWALVIEPGWVQAGIWRIQNQKAQVIYTSAESAWEVDEDLITSCDTALSSAIQDYPEEYEEPTKTVFGVSYNWVSGGEISPEYLEKIKKICKALSLTPVGFVVLPEAISHLIKGEEGTPLNAVILGVYKDSLEVSLFELGKLVGTAQVARSVSLVEDTVEGLSRLKPGGTFPSRFLLYDGKEGELEEIRQVILKSGWDDLPNLKFLHTPKVELVDSKKKIYAVSLAGASELANITSLEDVSKKEPLDEAVLEEDLADDMPLNEGPTPEELGFALEKDIQEVEKESVPVDEMIINESPPPGEPSVQEESVSNVEPVDHDVFEHKRKVFVKKFPLSGIKFDFLKKLPRLPKVQLSKSPLLMGLGFLIVLFLILGVIWWFVPKATVVVYVSPQRLEETVDLTVEVDRSSSDFSNKILAGEVLETTVNGERTKDTSGTKTVGDKASGEVTIYRAGPELNLPAGTVISGPDDLDFTLDSATKVASGSGILNPGLTKVKVSAENIGAQYNLAAGTEFLVGNYSSGDMQAKNESAFSGGTSREINAVSKDDLETLEKELTEELKEKADQDLEDKLDSERFLINQSGDIADSDADFNHKVGDEAKTLKLSLSLDVNAVSVKKTDLESMAKEALKEKVPSGFVLRGEQINYSFEKGASGSKESKFKVKVSANLLPEVNTDEIARKIVGRYPTIARQYLEKEAPGFVRAEIKINPSFPGRLKTLPHVIKNIDVQLSADR